MDNLGKDVADLFKEIHKVFCDGCEYKKGTILKVEAQAIKIEDGMEICAHYRARYSCAFRWNFVCQKEACQIGLSRTFHPVVDL